MKIAQLIKVTNKNGQQEGRLYKLSVPVQYGDIWDDEAELDETQYVIVSAANVMFSGPETYIFPANEDGEVLNWMELNGSFRGGLNHELALEQAGYVVEAE